MRFLAKFFCIRTRPLASEQINPLADYVAKIADQWLSAHDALELLAPSMERSEAARQIKQWAYLGVIISRAQMLWEWRPLKAEALKMAAAIPPHFWAARGRFPMKEDWNLGKFESWGCDDFFSQTGIRNPSDVHYLALNVEFESSDMLTMLPSHLRVKKAKVGRPEGYDWASLSAEVLEQFERSGGIPDQKSQVVATLREVLAKGDHHPAKDTVQRHAAIIWERLKKAEN